MVGLVKWCKWTQVSLLFIRAMTFESTVMELSNQFFLWKLTIIASMSFDEDVDVVTLSHKLEAIQDLRKSKVVLALALESTYWKIALAAHARGMLHGWAWIGLDTVAVSADYAPTDKRAVIDVAFNGWLFFEPWVFAGPDFFDRVHNATRSDFPTLFNDTILPSRYAAAMYDAITLLAKVAYHRSWTPDQGGRAFLNHSI